MHNVDSIAWLASDGAPWHGLGSPLSGDESREELLRKCGLDWEYQGLPMRYSNDGAIHLVEKHKVTVRSDTGAQLGVVGSKFQYVQPAEIVDTFLGVANADDLQIRVVGALDGGRRIWALASVGEGIELAGHDKVEPYVLLATANDGTMATRAKFTPIRVVCHNTWTASGIGKSAVVSVRHNQAYDHGIVRDALGISELWDSETEVARRLAECQVSQEDTFQFLTSTMGDPTLHITDENQPHKPAMRVVYTLARKGSGATLPSAANTAWGLFNAVTEYVDHARRAHSANNRLASAWFGDGDKLKERARQNALALAA